MSKEFTPLLRRRHATRRSPEICLQTKSCGLGCRLYEFMVYGLGEVSEVLVPQDNWGPKRNSLGSNGSVFVSKASADMDDKFDPRGWAGHSGLQMPCPPSNLGSHRSQRAQMIRKVTIRKTDMELVEASGRAQGRIRTCARGPKAPRSKPLQLFTYPSRDK